MEPLRYALAFDIPKLKFEIYKDYGLPYPFIYIIPVIVMRYIEIFT